jgi:hypothetical protein
MTTARSLTTWRPDIRRWRAEFREWRRTRPFWGGLLLAIAGIELLALPLFGVLSHHAIKLVIYIGIGGVFGILIGILLIAAGVMCWVNPAQRVFYGIAGIVLGLGSFPATNLGGFFLAMLMAIVGGSLAFAWTLVEPAASVADRPAPPPADDTDVTAGIEIVTGRDDEPPADAGRADTGPADTGPDERLRGTGGHRALAIASMPALLVAGLLAAPGHTSSPDELCILGICIGSSPSPSPTPTPSASASASASANPQPSTGTGTGPGTGSSTGASPSAGATTSGNASASPSPTSTKVPAASDGSGLVASSATSVLSSGSATLTHFKFIGVVQMPLANGTTEKMLKFTASSIDLTDGVQLSVTQDGLTTLTSSPTLSFSDDITLYATKLSGDLLGVPITFTPTTIDQVLLKLVNLLTGILSLTLTNVVTDQPLTSADNLTTGALSLGF